MVYSPGLIVLLATVLSLIQLCGVLIQSGLAVGVMVRVIYFPERGRGQRRHRWLPQFDPPSGENKKSVNVP